MSLVRTFLPDFLAFLAAFFCSAASLLALRLLRLRLICGLSRLARRGYFLLALSRGGSSPPRV